MVFLAVVGIMSVSQEKLSFLSTQCWWGHTLIVVSNSGPTLNLVALEDTREIWTYCKETNVGPQKWFYDCNSLFPTLSVVLGVGRYRSLEWGSEVEPEREEVRGCCYHYLLKTKIYFNWKKKKINHFPCVKPVLPVMVTGKWFPCLYLTTYPEFFHLI